MKETLEKIAQAAERTWATGIKPRNKGWCGRVGEEGVCMCLLTAACYDTMTDAQKATYLAMIRSGEIAANELPTELGLGSPSVDKLAENVFGLSNCIVEALFIGFDRNRLDYTPEVKEANTFGRELADKLGLPGAV